MFNPESIRGFVNSLTVQVVETNKEAGVLALAERALIERDRVLGGTPKPSSYRQFVDTVEGASVTSVKYNGVIVYVWEYLQEVARRCYEALVLSSPVDSGEYVQSISILLNDDQAIAGSSITSIDASTKKVTLVPTADYARRLEVGLRADGSPFVIQVPLHNVEMVAKMLRRRFGDLANIEFNYVDIQPAYRLSKDFRSRRRRPVETHVRYPAIIITPKTV